MPASSLDLDHWPFGWVNDAMTSRLLGLPPRFWSDQRPLWKELLTSDQSPGWRAGRWEALFHSSGSTEESLRAAWHLAALNSDAGLREEARRWLDVGATLSSDPLLGLERSWDQFFRLQDRAGAIALWPGADHPWPDGWEPKAKLLRQRLFSGSVSPESVGADPYFSCQVLDRDDLWGATWNGAVVRWSLVTDQIDLILPAGGSVSPIKLLAASSWFLYAFQDQSLLRYSKVTGTWKSFPYPPGWTGLRIQSVVVEGEESLLVAALGPGLWRWHRGEWALIDEGGGGPFLNALASDGSGGYWVGTKDRGLWGWKDGVWTPVAGATMPTNISVLEPDPLGRRWFVGTWGEGAWILEGGRLSRWSSGPDYVVAAAWTDQGPLWADLDAGLVWQRGGKREALGVRDGLPPGGVSALTVWEGRWIWGTTGQGWAWWNEYENPALLR